MVPGITDDAIESVLQRRLASCKTVYLPNVSNAVVERSKVVDYLLAADHPEGVSKAAFFRSFGFAVEDWRVLADALLVHAKTQPVSAMVKSSYGTKYQIDGPIRCPDGRTPSVRGIWIINVAADTARLVTAYPL